MGSGPAAGDWWKRLTKDRGLNGMDPIPKAKQHGGPDDSSDEEGGKEEDWEKTMKKPKNGEKKEEKK